MCYTKEIMDLMRKVTRTAISMQEFVGGTSGWVGAEIYEPANLPVWMKDAAHYGRFPCRSATGEIQVTLIIPKKTTTFDQITNLYRVFARLGSGPALILADDLLPKARGVLVRMHIPHIAGNAIYAPNLGIAY